MFYLDQNNITTNQFPCTPLLPQQQKMQIEMEDSWLFFCPFLGYINLRFKAWGKQSPRDAGDKWRWEVVGKGVCMCWGCTDPSSLWPSPFCCWRLQTCLQLKEFTLAALRGLLRPCPPKPFLSSVGKCSRTYNHILSVVLHSSGQRFISFDSLKVLSMPFWH